MQLASRFASRSPVLRTDHPLSDDQIRAVAPSIFAEDKHASRSERYSYIPTAAVLTELRQEGFQPFMVCQTRVRQDDRRDYTKHLIRLRHASQINGAEANEVILLNSHDGTSTYQLRVGLFRVVCTNGLIVSVGSFPSFRVAHRGDIVEEVVASALDISERFGVLAGRVERMEQRLLPKDEQIVFAERALSVRFPEPMESGIQAAQLLTCHRVEDLGNDLWSVMNKVQLCRAPHN